MAFSVLFGLTTLIHICQMFVYRKVWSDTVVISKGTLTRNEVVLLGRGHGLSVGTRVLCPPNRRRPRSAGVCLRNLIHFALPAGPLV